MLLSFVKHFLSPDLNFQSRPVRQLYNSDHLGGIFGSRQFPNYFNSYNPNQNYFHGAGAAAGAAAAASAGAAGGAGGAAGGYRNLR